mgnify:CR=1 FL=1
MEAVLQALSDPAGGDALLAGLVWLVAMGVLLASWRTEVADRNRNNREFAQMYKTIDTNNDGMVDYRELVQVMIPPLLPPPSSPSTWLHPSPSSVSSHHTTDSTPHRLHAITSPHLS